MSFVSLLMIASLVGNHDLVIRGGQIVDGTGNPWYFADVAIDDGVIVEIAPRIDTRGEREIDAKGLVVAPGFIDLHTHARRGIFEDPSAEFFIREGVTTIFEGPDGSSPVPIGPFLDRIAEADPAPNFATFVGHGSIRSEVMGQENRAPTGHELDEMRELVRQAMRDGAFGLSSGLFYTPGAFATTEEVIELARVAGEMGGIYITHMRDEMGGVVDSVEETIRIGEEAGIPAQITHHKVIGRIHEGLGAKSLELVDAARERGVDVTSDLYPYTASSTGLGSALLPKWAYEGGGEAMQKRLADPETRATIRDFVIEKIRKERGAGDPSTIQVASAEADPEIEGKNLAEIMVERGVEPTVENAADLALALLERGYVSGIFHAISEPDLERILLHPASMIASDGELAIPGKGSPHPRCCGTFPRVLALYVREKSLLTLEQAIRKMTSLPAQRVGLLDRGLLRPGLAADLVVFDPKTIRDRATFDEPHQYATGVSYVLVNGELVLDGGKMTAARPGEVLRGPATEEPAETGEVAVVLETTVGSIEVAVDMDRAPLSAGDFLRYVDRGLYERATFYRVVRKDNDHGSPAIEVVQGGLPENVNGLPPVTLETTEETGITHEDGVISLARGAPNSGGGSAFFICIGDQPALDLGGRRNADGLGFAAFGRVTRGMDVVRKIHALPADAPTTNEYMKGQLLTEPVKILSARRVARD